VHVAFLIRQVCGVHKETQRVNVIVTDIEAKNLTKMAVTVHCSNDTHNYVVKIVEGKTIMGGNPIFDFADNVHNKISAMLETDEKQDFEVIMAVEWKHKFTAPLPKGGDEKPKNMTCELVNVSAV
jgi:hypothetical protein